jgi:WD40 repeat protein
MGAKQPNETLKTKYTHDMANFITQRLNRVHIGIVRSIVTNNKDSIITCGDDFKINIINAENKEIMQSFTGHQDRIYKILPFSFNNNDYILSASLDRTVRVWSLNKMSLYKVFYISSDVLGAIGWIGKPGFLVIGNLKGRLSLFNFMKEKEVSSFGVKSAIWSLAVGEAGISEVYAGTDTGEVHLVDLKRRILIKTIGQHSDVTLIYGIKTMKINGRTLLLYTRIRALYIIDINDDHKEILRVETPNLLLRDFSIDYKNYDVYLVCCDNTVRKVNLLLNQNDSSIGYKESVKKFKHKSIQTCCWWEAKGKIITGDWLGYISICNFS